MDYWDIYASRRSGWGETPYSGEAQVTHICVRKGWPRCGVTREGHGLQWCFPPLDERFKGLFAPLGGAIEKGDTTETIVLPEPISVIVNYDGETLDIVE